MRSAKSDPLQAEAVATARVAKYLSGLKYGRVRKEETAARRGQRQHSAHWGWGHNILGFGAARKMLKKRKQPNYSVTFYVLEKPAYGRLLPLERIPETLNFFGIEVLTDVVQLQQPIIAHSLAPGAPVGHTAGVEGTLGPIVRKVGGTSVLGLSCSHVLARSGLDVAPGDSIESPLDNRDDTTTNPAGTLFEFNRLDIGPRQKTEDYALMTFLSNPDRAFASGKIPSRASTKLANEFRAESTLRRGIGSGERRGRVTAFQSTWTVKQVPNIGECIYSGCVAYTGVCDKGDSGAAVLSADEEEVYGIHVAGSRVDNFGLFFPIQKIFTDHDLELA